MINRLLNRVSPFRSVRARFSAVMGGSGIVLGLALTMFMEWHLEEGLRGSARDTLNAVADEIAHELNEDINNRQREVELMADMIAGRNAIDLQSIRKSMDELQGRESTYAWIGLADARGQVIAASGGQLQGVDVSLRPWFAAGLRGGFVGDPHDAVLLARYLAPRPDGEPLRFLDVAAPLLDKRGIAQGVLAGHLHWDWVRQVVSDTVAKRRKKNTVEVLIANRKGEWLLSFNRHTKLPGASLQAVQSDAAYLVATQKVVAAVPADGLGWTVVVRESIDSAHAPIYHMRKLMLAATTVLAALFALLSWLVAGRVVRPIVELADAARSHARDAAQSPEQPRKRAVDETLVLGAAMDQLAHHDRLTGLFNRSELLARLQQAIEQARPRRSFGALLLANLDNFTVLNNTRGHEAGDQLLVAVAARLRQLEDEGAVLARIGGDEFLVLLQDLGRSPGLAQERAAAMAATVLELLATPFALEDGACTGHSSIGVAVVGDDATTANEVLQGAELAMLEAKKRGKGQVAMFDQSMRDALHERVQFEQDLKNAIPGQLVAFYQPQVHLSSNLQGAELLVRWKHPVHGMVSPARFIPLAEETGLILPLGRWVLETACRTLCEWAAHPVRSHLVLAVNVSAREFSDPGYLQGVRSVLNATGANPQRLKLELTESVLAKDVDEMVDKMQALKALGISFSLDDFGTGFSSLGYLKRMPLDQLKIDQSFVCELATNANDASIVRAVVALGQGLGLQVIAEGVETLEQRNLLARYGCTCYQGYLYGRPAPIQEFEATIERAWER
ncbi:bifunctional diguanylate cyclase/phosphodiesterase [Acidovorax sp. Root217]|uniref:putative bifunctional diguanylate cyclase/phosphodiesterase n=1 Tax=Acidovorax sp. Root217 TaxID=1736492 RepID=UPI00070F5DD4|nr:EAL domain-containing protein [Acidovorax sp. Root217]